MLESFRDQEENVVAKVKGNFSAAQKSLRERFTGTLGNNTPL